MESNTIGIFGGSFNPVHIGHLMLANYLCQFTDLEAVWLTLSPLNPLKTDSLELISDIDRLKMLTIATKGVEGIGTCDIELSMPRPSYTINTLDLLARRYPRRKFKLIIGSDNLRVFDRWREGDRIKRDYGLIVYPRPGYPLPTQYEDGVDTIDAPQCNLSSTFIRRALARGYDMSYFLHPDVYTYIKENGLYNGK